jgi:predicted enzyme involved in methoxymalonyl-ACP biosynthesis
MSCRVLKRGMEEFVSNSIVDAAREHGITQIRGEYLPTKKNAMVAKLLPTYGYRENGENNYCLNVDEYAFYEHFINRKN